MLSGCARNEHGGYDRLYSLKMLRARQHIMRAEAALRDVCSGPPRHARIASASVVLQRFDLGFMLFLGGANGCGVLSHERHNPVARRVLMAFADPFNDPADVLGGPLLGLIEPAIGEVVSVRDRGLVLAALEVELRPIV